MQSNNQIVLLLCMFFVFATAFLFYYFIIGSEPRIVKRKFGDYEILEIYGLLTPDECDKLIKYSETQDMQDSQVIGNTPYSEDRKSKTLWLKDGDHKVAKKMAKWASKLTNYPTNHQEMLQVVRYDVGGKFSAHLDPQPGTGTETRYATLLVYLNDDMEGGETSFVKLGFSVKPEKGKGVLFINLKEDNSLEELAEHQAEIVKGGNKWICTKWIHTKEYK